MEEKRPLLEIENLEVVYRTDEATVRAVNGITFSLNEKETIGLVGETGAGKTTTALAILRLLPERTGRVLGGKILFRGENLFEKTVPEMRHVRGADLDHFPGSDDGAESGDFRRRSGFGIPGNSQYRREVQGRAERPCR